MYGISARRTIDAGALQVLGCQVLDACAHGHPRGSRPGERLRVAAVTPPSTASRTPEPDLT